MTAVVRAPRVVRVVETERAMARTIRPRVRVARVAGTWCGSWRGHRAGIVRTAALAVAPGHDAATRTGPTILSMPRRGSRYTVVTKMRPLRRRARQLSDRIVRERYIVEMTGEGSCAQLQRRERRGRSASVSAGFNAACGDDTISFAGYWSVTAPVLGGIGLPPPQRPLSSRDTTRTHRAHRRESLHDTLRVLRRVAPRGQVPRARRARASRGGGSSTDDERRCGRRCRGGRARRACRGRPHDPRGCRQRDPSQRWCEQHCDRARGRRGSLRGSGTHGGRVRGGRRARGHRGR